MATIAMETFNINITNDNKNERAKRFVEEVEKLAHSMAVHFFVVSYNGAMAANSYHTYEDVDIDHAWKCYHEFHKKFESSNLTFKDVYDYIQNADRDRCGYHYPAGDNKSLAFHIYDGRKQVNICFEGGAKPMAGFIFNEIADGKLEVQIVNIENGYADYDNMISISADNKISGGDWMEHLGSFGITAKEIFRDLLGPLNE